jgi:1,4-alpha-glucan branching enzyme
VKIKLGRVFKITVPSRRKTKNKIMSISKQFLKSKPVCKLTLTLPTDFAPEAQEISVVGDFNGWDSQENKMKKSKDGSFKAVIELEIGKEYQFRYLIDGVIWKNEDEADKFVPAGISMDENSVVVL